MIDKEEAVLFNKKGYFPRPHILQLEITNRCSLSCPQCYKDRINEGDMEVPLFRKLLAEADNLKVGTLMLNGGEPFEHHDIHTLLTELEKYSFQVHCYSSGQGLTDSILHFLTKTNIDFKLSISLNGSTKEIHSLSRDGYDISINAIKKLVKEGIPIGINWVCRQDNLYDFPSLVKFAKENGVKWINIAANKLSGLNQINSPLDTKDYVFLLNYLEQQEAVDPRYIRIQYCYNLLNGLRKTGVNQHLNRCGAGIFLCNIDIRGDFRPCTHLYTTEQFDSIMEYWNQSEALQELRKSREAKKKCDSCSKPAPCYFCKAMFGNTVRNFYQEPEACPVRELYQT